MLKLNQYNQSARFLHMHSFYCYCIKHTEARICLATGESELFALSRNISGNTCVTMLQHGFSMQALPPKPGLAQQVSRRRGPWTSKPQVHEGCNPCIRYVYTRNMRRCSNTFQNRVLAAGSKSCYFRSADVIKSTLLIQTCSLAEMHLRCAALQNHPDLQVFGCSIFPFASQGWVDNGRSCCRCRCFCSSGSQCAPADKLLTPAWRRRCSANQCPISCRFRPPKRCSSKPPQPGQPGQLSIGPGSIRRTARSN